MIHLTCHINSTNLGILTMSHLKNLICPFRATWNGNNINLISGKNLKRTTERNKYSKEVTLLPLTCGDNRIEYSMYQ